MAYVRDALGLRVAPHPMGKEDRMNTWHIDYDHTSRVDLGAWSIDGTTLASSVAAAVGRTPHSAIYVALAYLDGRTVHQSEHGSFHAAARAAERGAMRALRLRSVPGFTPTRVER
jgi:hypothetical protein